MSLSHSSTISSGRNGFRRKNILPSTIPLLRAVVVAVLLFSISTSKLPRHKEGFIGNSVATMAFSSPQQTSSRRRFVSGRKRSSRGSTKSSSARSATNGESGYTFRDSWSLITLGDLHMEDDMSHHEQARRDCLDALEDYPILGAPTTGGTDTDALANGNGDTMNGSPSPPHTFSELSKESLQAICQTPGGELTEDELILLLARKRNKYPKSQMVSLGDLGRKDIRHEQGDAGTTKSFVDAKSYFDDFGGIPYDLVTGNHDLEGLDEFDTDEANLQSWMDCFGKETPYFSRKIGDRTLLLGLSTVRFRDAPYSSHEVHVDDEQIEWFRSMVESHPESDGWKILVFSHAPILGSGLRVLQSVHVTNGCAWLNHCSPTDTRNAFVRIVKKNPQIKCWLSGHFHLSHDYQDALVQPVAGSPCAFLQVGVMGPGSSRDQRRQSRMIRGCGGEFLQLFSINHHERIPQGDDGEEGSSANTKARVRLDATLDLKTGKLIYADDNTEGESPSKSDAFAGKDPNWFQAYVPQPEDGCYIEDPDGSIDCSKKVCWWHMADGKVLGLHEDQLVEYDAETLSPLGVVVKKDKLTVTDEGGSRSKEVLVVQDKSTLVLVDDKTRDLEVIHPNADGSYWRKFQRNKKIRLEEKAREEVARRWLAQNIVEKRPTE